MRKTTVILLIIIQIVLLFFFENIHSFMNLLETKEIALSKEKIEIHAKYSLLKNGPNPELIKETDGFEYAVIVNNLRKEAIVEKIGNESIFMFDLKSKEGIILRFREKLDSPFSVAIRKFKGLISVFIIFVGIFTLLTGIYLVVLFKRKKQVTESSKMPMLQDYLSKLKESETVLKGIVDEQKVNVKRSEEINKSIVNRINAGIILVNEKGRIEHFNPFAAKIFSKSEIYSKNNVLNEVLKEFPEIIRFVNENINSKISGSVESGKTFFQVELLPIRSVGNLIIIRDITEDKKKEKLINSRKNFMMLGEMTTFLTHEIRNSLGVIYGYTKTLKGDQEKTGRINSEIIFLTEMMENFLNFSKPLSTAKTEETDPSQLIIQICNENGILVKINPETNELLKSDPNLLRSVFSNLVLNAKEAGAKLITVNILRPDEKMVTIEFIDDGKGMEEDQKGKIWYPFYTSKPKGTGMGLAIVKKMVNFLNGEIDLARSDKSGTMFKIAFYTSGKQIEI